MKNLWKAALCLFMSSISLASFAQERDLINEPDHNKAKIFTDLPDRLSFDQSVFQLASSRRTGEDLTVNFGNRVVPQHAAIISNVVKYEGQIQSLLLRLEGRDGAVMSISKITQQDGSVLYRGRIISHKSGDAYELQLTNGTYQFVKRDYYDLINE